MRQYERKKLEGDEVVLNERVARIMMLEVSPFRDGVRCWISHLVASKFGPQGARYS